MRREKNSTADMMVSDGVAASPLVMVDGDGENGKCLKEKSRIYMIYDALTTFTKRITNKKNNLLTPLLSPEQKTLLLLLLLLIIILLLLILILKAGGGDFVTP